MACWTYRSDVTSRDDTGSTDKGGTNVGNDGTVEVGHDHNVELLGLSDQLHGAVGSRVGMEINGVDARERTCYRQSCR